jgi:hypothetical protein
VAAAANALIVTVNDDTPQAFTPAVLSVNNTAGATANVALGAFSNVGADQPGTLSFVNIPHGEDSGFTSGGDPIFLFVTANGTALEGRTGSSAGTLVFTVTLNQGSDTYTVTMLGSVDNGSGVIFTDLSGGKAGNQPFKIITQPGASVDLLFTPINASSISSDSDDAGIAPSQFIDPGQGLRIDFGHFPSGPNGSLLHTPVNDFQFEIMQISNGNHADVLLRAVDADDDGNFTNDTTDPITEIQIYDPSGVLVGTADRIGTGARTIAFGDIVVNFEADGTVLITGLPARYSVLTETASGYDRIEITNTGGDSPGDGKFSVGGLSIEQTLVGHDVNMAFDVALTDADGDSVVSQIDITLTPNSVAPAGVAGEPINLGLTAPLAAAGAFVTVMVAGAPSGWTINGGTLLDDGTWTVQTTDPRSLSITSPTDFTGAILLNVTETGTKADGSTATIKLADNVEVYPVGSPIFAWSGDDFLTGSSGKDQFVFAQPIGHDTIFNFNPGQDQIDLIGYAGFSNFDDVQSQLTADANGNAVITLADGQTITLNGVAATSLSASNFMFDQMPTTNNAGTMTIGDGAVLPLSGIINNTGIIALGSIGNDTHLELIQHGITLQGGGQVILSDSSENRISGTLPSVTLTNVDNTISGAGQLGAGRMTLINEGRIVATGTHALIIDTGLNVVINSGTLEATGSGGLIVNSDISNSGLIWAYGGNITINGVVTGSGNALISGAATLEFAAASSVNVTFAGDNFGTLVLDNPIAYTGQIFGFTGTNPKNSDVIDLKGITFDADTSWVYYDNAGSNTGGALTIVETINGTTTAVDSITFANGDYTTANFKLTSDGHGGTLISDPPTSTTPDATVTSVVETTTLTTETAGSQTDTASAPIDDGTATAVSSTAVSDPDGSETTSVTINGGGAVAHTARIVSGPGSLMVNPGAAPEFTSLARGVSGNPTDNRTVEGNNTPELGRTAPSRDRSAVNVLEGQIAIASVMLVLEFLAENFKLASDANAGTLIADAPASPDAEVAAVAETRAVKAADTADTQATPVAADEGAVAALDAAIAPDGGMPDLMISSLPSDFALPENEGEEPTPAHETISLAYSEFADHGLHGSGKDHNTALNVATTNSAEGRTAAKASVSMSSHTTSSETGSDGNSNGGDAARIHDAIAGHSSTIDTVGTTISDSVSSSLRGATSGHLNDQPHFENATPGTLQSLESPTQAALHANEGRADHSHGAAAEHSPTVDTPATTIADSDVPGLQGEPLGHVNHQPQSGNGDPGSNGLGHQPRELPGQASAHAAKDIPLVVAVEDAKGGHAAHAHGAAAEDSSTIDTAGAAVAHTDSSGSQGAAPGDMNDQFHFANANAGNNGLGHQSPELPSQAASHPAMEIPASTTDNNGLGHGNDFNAAAVPNAVEDAKGSDKAQIRGTAAKDSSTTDVAGATVIGHNDSSSFQGAPSAGMNDQFHFANANPGNNGLGHQSLELPSQATSQPTVEIPPATTELAHIIDDVLTEAAQAALDPVATPGQDHDLAWTNAHNDKQSSHFIIHA